MTIIHKFLICICKESFINHIFKIILVKKYIFLKENSNLLKRTFEYMNIQHSHYGGLSSKYYSFHVCDLLFASQTINVCSFMPYKSLTELR